MKYRTYYEEQDRVAHNYDEYSSIKCPTCGSYNKATTYNTKTKAVSFYCNNCGHRWKL